MTPRALLAVLCACTCAACSTPEADVPMTCATFREVDCGDGVTCRGCFDRSGAAVWTCASDVPALFGHCPVPLPPF